MHSWANDDGNDEGTHQPVGRIVLYIDDLDRCTPRQVVDVLQAVHLLLALDLFVVVVGVDPRWLLHSLHDQYRAFLATDKHDAGAWRATPHDYLEKIFNIPFILPQLNPVGFAAMINRVGAATLQSSADGDAQTAGAADSRTPHNTDPALEQPRPLHALRTPGSARDPSHTMPEIDLTPLEPCETRFLAALAPLVTSPRSATRLLNLYRMLRSTEDLSPASRFLGGTDGQGGEFQAVALLLGIQTAEPALFWRLLDEPADASKLVPGGLTVRLPDQDWADLVDGLTPRLVDNRWRNDLGDLDTDTRDGWTRVVTALTPSRALVSLTGLTAVQNSAPHVARFSFHLD